MLTGRVVDEDHHAWAVLLDGCDGAHGRGQIGGRLEADRHDGDVCHFSGFDDAAFDEATEVEHQRRVLQALDDRGDSLARLQGDDAIGGQRRFVDVGGAVVVVVGDEDATRVLGVSNGVRGLTLSAFDRVEEDGHGGWIRK